ncbi:MAG: GxxExxY protein [Kiritimatiellia bacterium]|nr:GxxExxY protein [Kiritimatiellia bacterium]
MNASGCELVLKEEVYAVVGAALEVSNVLGAGFLEAVYQEALGIELKERKIPFLAQPTIKIAYKDHVLAKEYVPDFVCYDRLVVEIKAIKELTSIEQAQLLNYLKATGNPVGLLLNFGVPKLEWKRMAFSLPDIRVHSRSFADRSNA